VEGRLRLVAASLAAVLAVAACGPGERAEDGVAFGSFPVSTVTVGGEAWRVAVADTRELRVQGLRGVTDLGDVDGMLFEFEQTTTSGFTMRDTLIPLDIAFFAADGSLVDRLSMVPCDAVACPSYQAAGPFLWALETAAGGFEGVEPLTLEVPWRSPLVREGG